MSHGHWKRISTSTWFFSFCAKLTDMDWTIENFKWIIDIITSTQFWCALIAASATITAAYIGLFKGLSKVNINNDNSKKLILNDFACCYNNFVNEYPFNKFPYDTDEGKQLFVQEYKDSANIELLEELMTEKSTLLNLYGFEQFKIIRAYVTRITTCFEEILKIDFNDVEKKRKDYEDDLETFKAIIKLETYREAYNKLGIGIASTDSLIPVFEELRRLFEELKNILYS